MSRIAEIAARWSRVPAGPWEACFGVVREPARGNDVATCHDTNHIGDGERVAEAIAAAPDDVAWLLEVAEAAVACVPPINGPLVSADEWCAALAALRAALAKGERP